MNIGKRDSFTQSLAQRILLPPVYGYGEVSPRKPTVREVWLEWVDAIAFWRNSQRLMPAIGVAHQLITFTILILFFTHFFSWAGLLVVMGCVFVIATVYNTFWYHRYCCHHAFQFRTLWLARILLWTNPISFREENYAVPHLTHHVKSDEIGDPYGPHLGWLGSFLAIESLQKLNPNISSLDYSQLEKRLEHIGFIRNSYEKFQHTGSIENTWHYIARVVFANFFWAVIAYVVAGWLGVVWWFAAVSLSVIIGRDFNYRGHSEFFSFAAGNGAPKNQLFYGLLAGEWHKNHHEHPRSARNGFAWWQIDIPYWIIRLFNFCGLVTQYNK